MFAIATEDSVFFYDTQCMIPFSFVSDIHYSNLSDMSWSKNGRLLIITSIDGFCTFISFKENELGELYTATDVVMEEEKNSSSSSTVTTKPVPASTIFKTSNPIQV